MNFRRRTTLLLALLLPVLSGCSHIAYYGQAVSGHLRLMAAREPVDELLNDPHTPKALQEQLREAQAIRRYASDVLGLPDNDSYQSYVSTGRDFVTWNVVAAPAYSVKPRQWCFPVAGCVSYKGFFDQADADALAEKLTAEGLDVSVNGATAYSTIGWFDDPLLDTMLKGSRVRLAALIFHELAHQQLYVSGDSKFNEAFASLVEQEGVRRWLAEQGDTDLLTRYEAFLMRREQFSALLMSAREQLMALYASEADDASLAAGKAAVFTQLRTDYQTLRDTWDGYAGYDNWFSQPLNNARLVSIATYRHLVPSFKALFDQEGGDFTAFYSAVERLGELDQAQREEAVLALAANADAVDPDVN